VISCIDIIIGAVIIVYVISTNVIIGTTIACSIPTIGIGLMLILYHFFKDYLKSKRYFVKIKKYFWTAFCIGLLIFILIESIIIGCPKINKENTDYIIVLGTGLKDGEDVSKTLRDRLNTTVRSIYKDGNSGYIVVSGGQDEAYAMERYLIDQGVPKEKIIKENKSSNTYENLKFSKIIIEHHSGKQINDISVKIVTTDVHAFRSKMIALKNGYKYVKLNTSRTIFYLAPAYYTREAFFLIKSIFLS
jgi:uncharacterized SAM-binding protein YcdF (DUF218 family)